jgi:amidophosphoribosyltransferase
MCGIIGIVANQAVNQDLYEGLGMLQHRGQDAAGIMTCDDGRIFLRKENGLVRDVFDDDHMQRLQGTMGIGHVRYPTAGCESSAEAQPFYVNSPFGIALAHNGNLTNAGTLKRELFIEDMRHINTESDSEVLLNVLAHEIGRAGKVNLEPDDIFDAVDRVHQRAKGAYAVVSMITAQGILAFRDPNGIRPLCLGRRSSPKGDEWCVASESVALDVLGFELQRELEPGESVFINTQGRMFHRAPRVASTHTPCIFEFVYFARPDSVIENVYVHKARLRMGQKLASKILRDWPDHDIDVVIPIPDTSRTAALELSYQLGVVFREGFMKNRYVGRTFIMPGQNERKKSVKRKLNPLPVEFKGKNVLLVDDSIVRGTTSAQIIQMARDAGARKVYFASAAPPVRYPNVYGIDMPAASELVAHDRTEEEICRLIGADHLIFQELEDLIDAVSEGNPHLQLFDTSVFNADYVTGDIDDAYLEALNTQRCDMAKSERRLRDNEVVGLHNAA